jgi:hypothetical protein
MRGLDRARLLGTRPPPARPISPRLSARGHDIRSTVDVARLRRLVADLPAPRSRLGDVRRIEAAEGFVLAELEPLGWSVERRPFHLDGVLGLVDDEGPRRPRLYRSLDGVNLVATREGRRREAVVVVAHLDTLRSSPGANDNGAGVAIALELGRLLASALAVASSGGPFERSLVLAFPDFEELGLLGSRVLARQLVAERDIRAAIVLDAVGHRSRDAGSQRMPAGIGALYPDQAQALADRSHAGDFAAVIYRRSSAPIARALAEALAAVSSDVPILLRDPGDLPLTGALLRHVPFTRNFSRSDHRSFWDVGVPAIHVSDTANFRNPHYHTARDLPETVDVDFLADITAALFLVMVALASPAPTLSA